MEDFNKSCEQIPSNPNNQMSEYYYNERLNRSYNNLEKNTLNNTSGILNIRGNNSVSAGGKKKTVNFSDES